MSSMQWAGSTRILLDGAKAAVGCGRAVPALDYVGSASTALVGGTEDTHRSGTPAFGVGFMHRGYRCRWSRDSTGSRRTRFSNGGSSNAQSLTDQPVGVATELPLSGLKRYV